MNLRVIDAEFPTRNPMAEDCQPNGSILPNRDWFMLAANRVWGQKGRSVPKELEFQKIAESDRTCRAWSSGEYEPPCHKLILLLRGDDGGEFLDIAMEGASPAWWLRLEHEHKLAALAKSIFDQLGEVVK